VNILVISTHPDDAEISAGGFIATHISNGHQVRVLYLTCGEKDGMIGDSPEPEVRRKEAIQACSILGAKPEFLGWSASWLAYSRERFQSFYNFITDFDPDVLVAPWPVDTHPDHQVAGILSTQTAVGNPGLSLIFYETLTGIETQAFHPVNCLDITEKTEVKYKAVLSHKSQKLSNLWSVMTSREESLFFSYFGYSETSGRAEGFYPLVRDEKISELFSYRNYLKSSGARTELEK
jgi:LmbE family N-acetylglucosaminyl deacetylase